MVSAILLTSLRGVRSEEANPASLPDTGLLRYAGNDGKELRAVRYVSFFARIKSAKRLNR